MNENYEEDYEDAEIEQRLDKEDRVRQKRYAKQVGQYNNQMINAGIMEACKESGVSVEDFSRMSGYDVEMTASELKTAAKSMARGVIGKAKKGRPAKGRAPAQRQAQRQPGTLKDIDEKRRSGRVGSDDALLETVRAILPVDDPIWKYD